MQIAHRKVDCGQPQARRATRLALVEPRDVRRAVRDRQRCQHVSAVAHARQAQGVGSGGGRRAARVQLHAPRHVPDHPVAHVARTGLRVGAHHARADDAHVAPARVRLLYKTLSGSLAQVVPRRPTGPNGAVLCSPVHRRPALGHTVRRDVHKLLRAATRAERQQPPRPHDVRLPRRGVGCEEVDGGGAVDDGRHLRLQARVRRRLQTQPRRRHVADGHFGQRPAVPTSLQRLLQPLLRAHKRNHPHTLLPTRRKQFVHNGSPQKPGRPGHHHNRSCPPRKTRHLHLLPLCLHLGPTTGRRRCRRRCRRRRRRFRRRPSSEVVRHSKQRLGGGCGDGAWRSSGGGSAAAVACADGVEKSVERVRGEEGARVHDDAQLPLHGVRRLHTRDAVASQRQALPLLRVLRRGSGGAGGVAGSVAAAEVRAEQAHHRLRRAAALVQPRAARGGAQGVEQHGVRGADGLPRRLQRAGQQPVRLRERRHDADGAGHLVASAGAADAAALLVVGGHRRQRVCLRRHHEGHHAAVGGGCPHEGLLDVHAGAEVRLDAERGHELAVVQFEDLLLAVDHLDDRACDLPVCEPGDVHRHDVARVVVAVAVEGLGRHVGAVEVLCRHHLRLHAQLPAGQRLVGHRVPVPVHQLVLDALAEPVVERDAPALRQPVVLRHEAVRERRAQPRHHGLRRRRAAAVDAPHAGAQRATQRVQILLRRCKVPLHQRRHLRRYEADRRRPNAARRRCLVQVAAEPHSATARQAGKQKRRYRRRRQRRRQHLHNVRRRRRQPQPHVVEHRPLRHHRTLRTPRRPARVQDHRSIVTPTRPRCRLRHGDRHRPRLVCHARGTRRDAAHQTPLRVAAAHAARTHPAREGDHAAPDSRPERPLRPSTVATRVTDKRVSRRTSALLPFLLLTQHAQRHLLALEHVGIAAAPRQHSHNHLLLVLSAHLQQPEAIPLCLHVHLPHVTLLRLPEAPPRHRPPVVAHAGDRQHRRRTLQRRGTLERLAHWRLARRLRQRRARHGWDPVGHRRVARGGDPRRDVGERDDGGAGTGGGQPRRLSVGIYEDDGRRGVLDDTCDRDGVQVARQHRQHDAVQQARGVGHNVREPPRARRQHHTRPRSRQPAAHGACPVLHLRERRPRTLEPVGPRRVQDAGKLRKHAERLLQDLSHGAAVFPHDAATVRDAAEGRRRRGRRVACEGGDVDLAAQRAGGGAVHVDDERTPRAARVALVDLERVASLRAVHQHLRRPQLALAHLALAAVRIHDETKRVRRRRCGGGGADDDAPDGVVRKRGEDAGARGRHVSGHPDGVARLEGRRDHLGLGARPHARARHELHVLRQHHRVAHACVAQIVDLPPARDARLAQHQPLLRRFHGGGDGSVAGVRPDNVVRAHHHIAGRQRCSATDHCPSLLHSHFSPSSPPLRVNEVQIL
eukprot:Rhum_TRINITY_DN8504_c0_g1::Rhum_TRINITY_DN8504_c0_g1_i1::g.28419::m.28419